MAYKGKQKGNYGNQRRPSSSGFNNKSRHQGAFSGRDLRLAKAAFEGRSEQSQRSDLAKEAPIARSLEIWLRSPASFDIPGIDTKLSTDPKDRQKQALQLSQIAAKKKLEIEVRKPKDKKPIKRFRVVKKAEAKQEVEKELKKAEEKAKVELAKAETAPETTEKRHLPSAEEIYAEAVKMWQRENNLPVHEGFMENVANPTRAEMQEEGLLNAAKLKLMTSQDTVSERQTLDYVDGIRHELLKIGFDVVPISGFDSSDLQF